MDIVGNYCAIILHKTASDKISKGGLNYGGNLTGLLIAKSTKWNKNWKTSSGDDVLILFIDTNFVRPKSATRNQGSFGKFLTRKKVRELLAKHGNESPKDKTSDITVEELVELVKKWNL